MLIDRYSRYFHSKYAKLYPVKPYTIETTGFVTRLIVKVSDTQCFEGVITDFSKLASLIKPESEWRESHPELFI